MTVILQGGPVCSENQRRHERHPVNAAVTVRRIGVRVDPSAKEEFGARLVDLSLSGAHLELKELLHAKEKVRVIVDDERIGFRLNCTGTVRWSHKVTGGYEAGVEFAKVEKLAGGAKAGKTGGSASVSPS